jgi:hypothetical protein
MQQFRTWWNKNFLGKVTIVLVSLVVVCCALGAIFGRSASRGPQETANAFATITTGLATREVAQAPTPTATAEPTPRLPPPRPSGDVSRAEFGDKWPLTVEAGELLCIDQAVVLDTGGITYAVNGTAKDRADASGWQDIEAIWADGDAGLKKDIGPLIERGLALC